VKADFCVRGLLLLQQSTASSPNLQVNQHYVNLAMVGNSLHAAADVVLHTGLSTRTAAPKHVQELLTDSPNGIPQTQKLCFIIKTNL